MITINGTHQLFLDDYCVERTVNIDRRVNMPEKCSRNPILSGGRPWDTRPILFGTVEFRGSGGYRMWYDTGSSSEKENFTCYAESDDGIEWRFPDFNDALYEGKKTNIVFGTNQAPDMAESYTVLRDPADPDPARLYKTVYKVKKKGEESPYRDMIFRNHLSILESVDRDIRDRYEKKYREMISAALFLDTQKRSVGTAVSPDGLSWRVLDTDAVRYIGDTAHLCRDPATDGYLLYARDFFVPESVYRRDFQNDWFQNLFWGRAVRLVESDDFEHWRAGDLVLFADELDLPGDEIYSVAVFPYEGIFIGLIQMYHAHPDINLLDIQLGVSRDGRTWARVGDRAPFITPGGVGDWDRFNLATATAPVKTGQELRFYYSGHNKRHKLAGRPYAGAESAPVDAASALGFASLPVDRFVSMEAGFAGGTIVTKPLVFEGRNLHVNACAAHGCIDLSLLDAAGKPMPEYEKKTIRADSVDIEVVWGVALPEGPVKLKFDLANARLYSLWSV